MLKADLHLHTLDDPEDGFFIRHSARKLVDEAASQDFAVLAITLHNKVFSSASLSSYAKKKGILLIPGAELTLEGKHVLVYNITEKERAGIKTLADLKQFKEKKHLVIAPHPFYPGSSCLGKKVLRYKGLFDALEYCHFYPWFFNGFNKKAENIAKQLGVPMIGNGDVHWLFQFGHTYSQIDAPKNVEGVIAAIKKGKVQVKTRPLPFWLFVRVLLALITTPVQRVLNCKVPP
ncbi:PHP domain-containing protein [Candidatus Woesearchaeota archaeon]|nr:PHP domain-containing protein [Candidatus Woesearchaeota archaeon]